MSYQRYLKRYFGAAFLAIINRFQEEDWSSDSDEGAREDALDAAGLGDVRDVYQVFCSLYSGVLVGHPPFKGGRHKFFVYITVKRAAVRGSQRAQGEEEAKLMGRDASDAQEGRGLFWFSVSKTDAKEADTEKAGNRVPRNQ